MLRGFTALFAVVLTGCGLRQLSPAVISVCELSRDFSGYRGKLMAVRGVYFNGLRQNCPQTCTAGPWPSFVDLVGLDHKISSQPPVGFILEDAGWAALDIAERAAERGAKQGRRVEVWVTVLGRLKANPRRSHAGPCDIVVNGGYGHLAAFPAQLVAEGFSDIQVIPNANSPYDYSQIYRGAL
jgi:hypothetical protein